MKNYIPLGLAVLLGLAAVLSVSRMINKNKQAPEETSWVVAAQRDLKEGESLTSELVIKKEIPLSARPADAIVWSKRALIEGQKVKRAIRTGDYVLLSDIGLSRSMASLVGEGEWAVTMSVGNAGIGRVVQPGDEVAVIATFNLEMDVHSADVSSAGQKIEKEVTLVLFPRVRVLENSTGSGGRGESGGEIVLALPPQQAQVLIAAQRKATLNLALRRLGDNAALSRKEPGLVDDTTFQQLLKDIESVKMPFTPNGKDGEVKTP